jgi:periplasmic divalent cation tolerance protein
MPFLMCYVTFPDLETARLVVRQLLDARLVACANLFPVESLYRWEGCIQQETECAAWLKTSMDRMAEVEAAIRRLHPYEVPCIVRREVSANADYEAWVAASNDGFDLCSLTNGS